MSYQQILYDQHNWASVEPVHWSYDWFTHSDQYCESLYGS